MKKRYAALVLALMGMVILMTSCGTKDVTLTMGEKTVIEDYIEFTPVNILVRPDTIYAPKGTTEGWVYNGENKGQTYVALIARVKNFAEESIKMVNFAHAVLEQGEKEYDTYECMLLTSDDTALERNGQLGPGEEGTVYILMDGQEQTCGQAEIRLSFRSGLYDGEESYILACDTSKTFAVANPLKQGETVKSEGYGSMTLKRASACGRVNPSKASSNDDYDYYTPKSKDETILDMQVEVRNLQKKKSKGQTFIGAMAVCDNTFRDGFVMTETADGSNFKEDAMIEPGGRRTLHTLLNVPKSWKDKEVMVYLYFDGKEYEYVWNKGDKK